MDRERATTFGVAAAVLALALIALVAIDQTREHDSPAPRPSVQPARRAPAPVRAPSPPRSPAPATAVAVARRFAGDWLDYLAGRRPVSAVRGADPSLLVSFAGGDASEAIGPGRQGLRAVHCRPPRGRRRDCRAAVAGLAPLRFAVIAGARPRVVALVLD